MYIDIIKEHLTTLTLFNGSSIRTNCPICSNINTFSISDFRDCIKFNCFHADCGVKGVINKGLEEDSFKEPVEITRNNDISECLALSQNWRKNEFPIYGFVRGRLSTGHKTPQLQ